MLLVHGVMEVQARFEGGTWHWNQTADGICKPLLAPIRLINGRKLRNLKVAPFNRELMRILLIGAQVLSAVSWLLENADPQQLGAMTLRGSGLSPGNNR